MVLRQVSTELRAKSLQKLTVDRAAQSEKHTATQNTGDTTKHLG